MKIERLTDTTFERTIARARQPILVTFSAPVRCAACREQKPALGALAAEGYPIFMVDVEQPDSKGTLERYAGKGVPFHKVYVRGSTTPVVEHLGVLDTDGLLGLLHQAAQQPAPPRRRGGAASLGGFLGGFGQQEPE